MSVRFHSVDGHDLCRVHVRPCPHPVDAAVTQVDTHGQHRKVAVFYVRVGNGTRPLDGAEREKCIAGRWPGT